MQTTKQMQLEEYREGDMIIYSVDNEEYVGRVTTVIPYRLDISARLFFEVNGDIYSTKNPAKVKPFGSKAEQYSNITLERFAEYLKERDYWYLYKEFVCETVLNDKKKKAIDLLKANGFSEFADKL